jgi:hypothetical protein
MQQLTISDAALHPTALHGGLQQRHMPQDVCTWPCVLSSWAACKLQPAGYLGCTYGLQQLCIGSSEHTRVEQLGCI